MVGSLTGDGERNYRSVAFRFTSAPFGLLIGHILLMGAKS